MTPNEFFKKYNGKWLDADEVYPDQCVDVTKAYWKEVLGIAPMKGNAIDYWKDIPGFERIPYAPNTAPKPNDIVIWKKSLSNQYGHIGICVWSRKQDFSCFEQNWPLRSPCHFQEHTYWGVIGWLRPLNQPAEAPRPTPVKPPEQPQAPWRVPLTVVGADIPGLAEEVAKWSKGDILLDIKMVPKPLLYDPSINYERYVQDRFCIVACDPAPEIYKTTMTNDLQRAYAIAGPDATACSYEVSHMLHKYYLAHRGTNPYIELEDTVGNVLDEQRYRKYNVLKPYMALILL